MIRDKPNKLADYLPIAFPSLVLLIFFVIPFGTMVAISFFERDPASFYTPAFVFDNYQRFFTAFFGGILGFSLWLAICVALICLLLGFPFTWYLSRRTRSIQIFWLISLLSILSLSEVIIGFAWSTLFSRTAGITNLFVALGLMSEAKAWLPGFGAVLTAMVYQAFPYTVLILYPALVRLDPELDEAARTLGASPLRTFVTVTLPVVRNTLVASGIMVFVFALGSYLLPQILGRPNHWTLSVMITDQAIYQSNMPFAAAMAVFLVVVTVSMVALTAWAGRESAA